MLLPGKTAIARKIVTKVRDHAIQAQPCGVDLSLQHISRWTSPAVVDFSNKNRLASKADKINFTNVPRQLHLETGHYLVEFNEQVDVPLDIMGQIFVRSSLWRSGAMLNAGVIDSGYRGAVGAMLQVVNPKGITLYENARLAQVVFHEMSEQVDGYHGVYQGSSSV